MMKIPQTRLSAFCNVLSALVPECRLMITDQGWNTLAVDTANVAMVSANLPKAQFDEFTETEKAEIGLDLMKLKDFLKVMDDEKSTITIERKEGRLIMSDGRYTVKHTPLDVQTVRKRPNPPSLSLPAAIDIDAGQLQEAIKAMGVISDKVRLGTCKEGLALDAEGDTDQLHKVLESTGKCQVPDAAVRSLFSLDYLKEIGKAMKGASTCTALLGQDHPIRFDFELDGMECGYFLAPRLEGD